MHPARELSRLAAHKAALRRDIAVRRHQCATAAVVAAQPLVWLDRLRGLWQRFAPFAPLAAVPLTMLLKKRSAAGQPHLLSKLIRWAPVVLSAVRGFAGTRQP